MDGKEPKDKVETEAQQKKRLARQTKAWNENHQLATVIELLAFLDGQRRVLNGPQCALSFKPNLETISEDLRQWSSHRSSPQDKPNLVADDKQQEEDQQSEGSDGEEHDDDQDDEETTEGTTEFTGMR